ncbi:ParB/RepB/Spo0J family partition protein [Sodalis ligni]|uniref:ParB/RepB/Spo0J family partition protein n=1 Tax=Sodalis ligni TaxID=2697027 RepID=UPI00104CAA13|nr:ParB/RepB/Spo0J family partition protein [Sodalis ligni]
MRFPFPLLPGEFELPDEWLAEFGLTTSMFPLAFKISYSGTTISIPLAIIEPPWRGKEFPSDWRGFNKERMKNIFNGIILNAYMVPVQVMELPYFDYPPNPFKYRVYDGFHRFYAAIAFGLKDLPVIVC